MKRTLFTTVLTLAYVGTIIAANWAVAHYGVIPVGFGLAAPAGVLFAGLAFTLRDLLHEAAGWRLVVAAILAGTAASLWVAGPGLAFAAAAAFLLSELVDLAVYTPLRRRRWLTAVAASNVAGLLVDSWLFLALAFGSLAFFWGQVVGKGWMTVVALLVLAVIRFRRREVLADA
ncbi:VUT family protein [Micromonospora sediminicola]|uniref:VUT family protein n=1 Tax=Micromonospora sediminicola TaxID=946078 RepID=UPI0037AE3A30